MFVESQNIHSFSEKKGTQTSAFHIAYLAFEIVNTVLQRREVYNRLRELCCRQCFRAKGEGETPFRRR